MLDFGPIDTRIRVTGEQLKKFTDAIAAEEKPGDPEGDVYVDQVFRNASVEALRSQEADLREQLAALWAYKISAQTAVEGCTRGPEGSPCGHCEIAAHRILLHGVK